MTWEYLLRLAVVRVGLTPDQFWLLTFTELGLMVDQYYHHRDLQTLQTREIVAMIYNVNRSKGPPKDGKDFMPTFEEGESEAKKETETPTTDVVAEIKRKYGG